MKLRRVSIEDVGRAAPRPVDTESRRIAEAIVEDVRDRGLVALREHAERLDGLEPDGELVLDREALRAAAERVDRSTLALLERTAERIRTFAVAQRSGLVDLELPIEGGRAGQRVVPVERAGCYAPGGRYPLPSSVLMTAVTARAAGVREVVVASPRPGDVTLAAAFVAGADCVLAAGGAQAIAALALGAGIERVDVVVGPGNRFVTAAKQLLFGEVGVDVPAGPSELAVVADESADPELVAADLIAQAEHDPDARPILVASTEELIDSVERALEVQLSELSTAEVAREALSNGFAVFAPDRSDQKAAVDAIAPEHLQLCVANAAEFETKVAHCGAAFIGERSAEVLGDYGAGPNHVLPTGGAARFSGGLSVHDFLRVRTWLELDDPSSIAADAEALARLEGLEGHARAAAARSGIRRSCEERMDVLP